MTPQNAQCQPLDDTNDAPANANTYRWPPSGCGVLPHSLKRSILFVKKPKARKLEKKRSERSEKLCSANVHGLRPSDKRQINVV